MMRFFYIVLSAVLLFSFIATATTTPKSDDASCLKCHEDTYVKAVSFPYQHSVVKETCTLCHFIEERGFDRQIVLRSTTLQSEGTVFIGELDEMKKFKISVEAIDDMGKKSKEEHITIGPAQNNKHPISNSPLKTIKDVKLEELVKGMFVQATISWKTDSPATTEVEYKEKGGKFRLFAPSKNLFTLDHKVSLKGLKHKSNYIYKVVSRDMNGAVLSSKEFTLDTSGDVTAAPVPEAMKKLPITITSLKQLKVKDVNGTYLKIMTNKAGRFMVWLKEIDESKDRPCVDFKQTRYSTIDVCIKCHPQDSSHPVGVRSKNPKVVVSDQLPTIDNGIITCVSCHFSHGGKKPYYVRVDFTKEICVKCHQSYYGQY